MANPDVWKQRQNNLNLYRQTSGGGDRLDCVLKRCTEAHNPELLRCLWSPSFRKPSTFGSYVRSCDWQLSAGLAFLSQPRDRRRRSVNYNTDVKWWFMILLLLFSHICRGQAIRSPQGWFDSHVVQGRRLGSVSAPQQRSLLQGQLPSSTSCAHSMHAVSWIAEPCYSEPAFTLTRAHVSAEALKRSSFEMIALKCRYLKWHLSDSSSNFAVASDWVHFFERSSMS